MSTMKNGWRISNRTDSNLKFRNLNELVMVKCSSKAIWETVGSIIVEKTYLTAENFSKEIV